VRDCRHLVRRVFRQGRRFRKIILLGHRLSPLRAKPTTSGQTGTKTLALRLRSMFLIGRFVRTSHSTRFYCGHRSCRVQEHRRC
jgi:hypothetical protein